MMSKSSFCTFFFFFFFFLFSSSSSSTPYKGSKKLEDICILIRDIKDSVALLKTREIPPCRRPGPHRFGRSFPPRPDTQEASRRKRDRRKKSPPRRRPFSLGGGGGQYDRRKHRANGEGVPARGDFDDEKTTVDDVTKTLREESRSHPTFYPSERIGDRVIMSDVLNSRGAKKSFR